MVNAKSRRAEQADFCEKRSILPVFELSKIPLNIVVLP
jgi:hypothetical protein